MLQIARHSRGLRILVVDYHARMRQLIMLILEQADHLVDDVSSATEALARLQQVQYDVVLSDNVLCENISGLELAQKVRQRWPEVGFILATGLDNLVTREQAVAAGVGAILAKPFSGADLRRTMWQVGGYSSRFRTYGMAQ